MFKDKSVWTKIAIIGIIKLVSMLVMQRLIGNPILEWLGLREAEKGPPATFFLVSISIISLITGCLYAVAYLLIGQKIAVRNHSMRAVVFGLFIYFSNYLAQSLGLAGASGPDVLMSFEWDHAVFDFFSYLITFAVCGLLFVPETIYPKPCIVKKKMLIASFSGMILFPVLMLASTQAMMLLLPSENMITTLRIAQEAATTFYIIFYSCFALTGLIMPIFYIHTEYKSEDRSKHIKFAFVYSFLIWMPVVFAMFAFGININSLVIFTLESFAVIYITLYITDRILR